MASLESLWSILSYPSSRNARYKRQARPNLHQIHSKPLPLATFLLPPIIPHNPISVLYFAYTYISQLFYPPSSHPRPRLRAWFSESTSSVHVTDPATIRHLWESGFFGKGALSRSEPTWLDREKKRQGFSGAETSENYTAARRRERKKFKQDRARKEQEAINEKLMEELLVDKVKDAQGRAGRPCVPTLRSKYEGIAEAALLSPSKQGFLGERSSFETPAVPTESLKHYESNLNEKSAPSEETPKHNNQTAAEVDTEEPIEDVEHLQLTLEEAFFLNFALGNLDIHLESLPPVAGAETQPVDVPAPALPPLSLLHTFAAHSAFPPEASHGIDPECLFLLNYAAYHHFRSLGWVVRPGIKFGVDWLLYLRGPVFSHAEFAVVIKSSSSNRDLSINDASIVRNNNNPRSEGQKDWHWFHSIQRVQAQVRKGLIFAWVDAPPPDIAKSILDTTNRIGNANGEVDASHLAVKTFLQHYKVQEMIFKRWIPNRSRD